MPYKGSTVCKLCYIVEKLKFEIEIKMNFLSRYINYNNNIIEITV